MKIRKVALTTFDNPFDPIDDFRNWFTYDISKGYNTCGVLDKNTNTEKAKHDIEEFEMIEAGIDDIIKLDFTNTYKKVVKEVEFEILEDEGEQSDDLTSLD